MYVEFVREGLRRRPAAVDPQESVAKLMNKAPETGRSTNAGSAYRYCSRAAASNKKNSLLQAKSVNAEVLQSTF